MSKVQISNVVVLNNPAPFQSPFQFEVTLECIEDLPSGVFFRPCFFSEAKKAKERF